jgi:3-oxoacyl-[acyl-carrier protein] reductase
MSRSFEGQTVLVTGASRGLGRAIAQAFGAEGAYVGIAYRVRSNEADETKRLVEEAGGSGALVALDVRDRANVDAAVDGLLAARGRVDVLVNNAAVVRDELFPVMAEESWEEVLDVNLSGVFRCARAVARPMMARKKGAIVNVASVAGVHASVGQANYAASKGGVIALTRTLAAELAPRGIRVNAVVPGLLTTGMAARLDKREAARKREAIPLQRFGDAEEVARAVLFLASEGASYVIGQALVVDGGLSL